MMSGAKGAGCKTGSGDPLWFGRPQQRGQAMVEFAMVGVLFILLLLGVAEGSWYVLEVSAVNNSARTPARWEVTAANFTASQEPECSLPSSAAPLVAPARSTAGPFAGAITAASITNTPVYGTLGGLTTQVVVGCTVTITVTYQPLESLVHIGPSSVSSTFTAHID